MRTLSMVLFGGEDEKKCHLLVLLRVHGEDALRCLRLLQLVVDGDERLNCARRVGVELDLAVVQRLQPCACGT